LRWWRAVQPLTATSRRQQPLTGSPAWPDYAYMFLLALALVAAPGEATVRRPQVTASQIRSIISRCRVPAKWLTMGSDGSTHFKPPVTARYKDIDCVLRRMRALHVGPVAYIGNETGF